MPRPQTVGGVGAVQPWQHAYHAVTVKVLVQGDSVIGAMKKFDQCTLAALIAVSRWPRVSP